MGKWVTLNLNVQSGKVGKWETSPAKKRVGPTYHFD